MPLLRDVISWLSTKPLVTRPISRTGMKLGFARRFIAGETLEDALKAAAELNSKGLLVIMNQLGENVTQRSEAEAAYESYHRILRELSARGIRGNITIKPTQLGLDFAPDLCRDLTLKLASEAAALHNVVEIDMEHSSVCGATIDLFEQVRSRHDNVGLAVQAYLRRTEDDLKRLVSLHPKVRLVKGAYLEPPAVAFPEKRQVDESYRALMETLFRGGFTPAIATHDEAMIDHALELARARGLNNDQWEVQMLLGIRRDLQEKLARDGIRVRVYVTFGTQWVPYFMRRLAERPANVAFVLKSLLRGA
ncbi:MAG: proline dehydrogenase family protein [Candidatus Eiseniibacteriota bacterium]